MSTAKIVLGEHQMTIRQDMLRAKAREIAPDLEQASEIAAKAAAANRAMTRDERETYDAAMAKAAPVLAGLRAARSDASVEAYARGIFNGGPAGSAGLGAKSKMRLSFKTFGADAARAMMGTKTGLAPTGAELVRQSFIEDPISLGKVAGRILDIIPVEQRPSPQYAYLRATVRDNQAEIVEEGALKPTSDLGLERVESSLEVLATLGTPTPKYWLSDSNALQAWVEGELAYMVEAAVENKIVTDVSDASGIQVQDWATNVVTTLRKAVTKLQSAGWTPSAFVINPLQWEEVSLALVSNTGLEHLGLQHDPVLQRLFGVPVVVSTSQPNGTGLLLGEGAVAMSTDTQGIDLQWSDGDGGFERNLMTPRCEMRLQTDLYRPTAVVAITLAD
jgi:HK97 family phage major capsid protein